jgi:hypothetical protein
MPDFLNRLHICTISHQDIDGYYRVTAKGTLSPSMCDSCGYEDFYKHGSQHQEYMDAPMHGTAEQLQSLGDGGNVVGQHLVEDAFSTTIDNCQIAVG